jgi:succinyl-CoA synthetase beta subunit
MKIHEYQAREIFRKYGMPVPPGDVCATADEVKAAAARIGKPVVVKAQVHVGGRGKAGGVKIAQTPDDAWEIGKHILGMDIKGLTVKKVLVAQAVDIESEAYIGVIVDRQAKGVTLMASAAGGVDIEEVARETPEKIVKLTVDPLLGINMFQARRLAFAIYDDKKIAGQAAEVLMKLYRAFWENDCSLAEVNPLVVTPDGEVLAIDAKINIDDNALYRHPDIEQLRDLDAEVAEEVSAREYGLSFVKLDGNIGCCVNGAGLAMATMDLVKKYGGEPANFLDIGGSSNPEKVVAAMRIIAKDPNVKAILFNIFGGITRCDDVANGLKAALAEFQPDVPLTVRLTGTNEAEGRKILESIGINAKSMMVEAVQAAIDSAGVNPVAPSETLV